MYSFPIPHPVRVGLVSLEPIRLVGLTSVFQGHATVTTVSGDLETLLADLSLGCLILDGSYSRVHEQGWMGMLLTVRRARPDVRAIVLGPTGNDELVMRAILAGARAYLDSNAGPFVVRQAVEVVIQGSIWAPRRLLSQLVDRLMEHPVPAATTLEPVLSPREQQVLDLIMTARSNREIAGELGIEERTVKAYVASLMRKTGSENRVTLSVQATQNSQRNPRGQGYPGAAGTN